YRDNHNATFTQGLKGFTDAHDFRFQYRYGCGLFFFYCYGAHRDLHSFPTRRSSDLAPSGAERSAEGEADINGIGIAHWPAPLMSDRKSTRLNSSHVSKSYAVFCLKKKIQKKVFRSF